MFLLALLSGCTQSEPISAEADDALEGGARNDSGCVPSSEKRRPRSVLDVVRLINSLPKPLGLPCFLESLERPLELDASRSIFSAQPAVRPRSPRMFLFSDPLVMTVVPEGVGSHLLEMSELLSVKRSLKAEIEFPVNGPLADHEPFEGLMFNERVTNCAFCHAAEEPATHIDFARAFVSQALRPQANERVMVQSLLLENDQCDIEAEPERCAMLEAIFGHGEVVDRAFPEDMDTFF